MSSVLFNVTSQPELAQTCVTSMCRLQNGLLAFVSGWAAWQYVVTVLLGVIIYDQCKHIYDSAEGLV